MSKSKAAPVSMKRSVLKKTLLLGAIILPFIALAAFGGYYFKQYNELKKTPITAEQAAADEESRVLEAVSKLYDVPKDEKPQIAAVKDKEVLKKENPVFFDKVENGDRLLLYQKAQLALLYRPSTNQLIKVGPLQVQNNPVIKIVGRASDKAAVEKALTGANLAFKDGGEPKGNPANVTIVDLKGTNAAMAQQLAGLLKGQVGPLPDGEDRPTDADILIIVGPAADPLTTP